MAKKSSKKPLQKLNETGRRTKGSDRRTKANPVNVNRRKVQRRRQIDPTTCERDYTDAEIEFMQALDEYKRQSGRMFPTCSEILEVIQKLGYQKASESATCCDGSDATTKHEQLLQDEAQEMDELEPAS